jgi:integrase
MSSFSEKVGEIFGCRFHDLRHVAISRLLEKGFPHALAMKISGHKQMTTFLRYVNPTTESLVELMRKSEAINLASRPITAGE